jgi:cytochrome c-type biogenesis protein CcmE
MMLQMIEVVCSDYIFQIPEALHQETRSSTMRAANRIGGLVVKLAVAKQPFTGQLSFG